MRVLRHNLLFCVSVHMEWNWKYMCNFIQGQGGQEGDGDGQRHHRVGERRRSEHRPRIENDRYDNETCTQGYYIVNVPGS